MLFFMLGGIQFYLDFDFNFAISFFVNRRRRKKPNKIVIYDVSMRLLVRQRDSCRDHPGQIQLSLPHAELNAGVSGLKI